MANLFKKENRFYNKIKLAFYIVEDVKDELDLAHITLVSGVAGPGKN